MRASLKGRLDDLEREAAIDRHAQLGEKHGRSPRSIWHLRRLARYIGHDGKRLAELYPGLPEGAEDGPEPPDDGIERPKLSVRAREILEATIAALPPAGTGYFPTQPPNSPGERFWARQSNRF